MIWPVRRCPLRQLEPDCRQLASHPLSPVGLWPRGFLFGLTTSTLSPEGSAPSPVRVGVGLGSVVLVLSCPLPVTPEPLLSLHQKPRKSSSPLSHTAVRVSRFATSSESHIVIEWRNVIVGWRILGVVLLLCLYPLVATRLAARPHRLSTDKRIGQ